LFESPSIMHILKRETTPELEAGGIDQYFNAYLFMRGLKLV